MSTQIEKPIKAINDVNKDGKSSTPSTANSRTSSKNIKESTSIISNENASISLAVALSLEAENDVNSIKLDLNVNDNQNESKTDFERMNGIIELEDGNFKKSTTPQLDEEPSKFSKKFDPFNLTNTVTSGNDHQITSDINCYDKRHNHTHKNFILSNTKICGRSLPTFLIRYLNTKTKLYSFLPLFLLILGLIIYLTIIVVDDVILSNNDSSRPEAELWRFAYSRPSVYIVLDGVMGGVSTGYWSQQQQLNSNLDEIITTISEGDSISDKYPNSKGLQVIGMQKEDVKSNLLKMGRGSAVGIFSGKVRDENNGGFSSARFNFPGLGIVTAGGFRQDFEGFWVAARINPNNNSNNGDRCNLELSLQVRNIGQYIYPFTVTKNNEFKIFYASFNNRAWTSTVYGWRRSEQSFVSGFGSGQWDILDEVALYAIKPRVMGDFNVEIGGVGVY